MRRGGEEEAVGGRGRRRKWKGREAEPEIGERIEGEGLIIVGVRVVEAVEGEPWRSRAVGREEGR